ncbi:hypothetical protein PUN28_005871 [Cardiocondyla obscurior]|uniref:Uncharacterized protein n=1 Tax=Cardiocondyla obscurior TaxID=286306 RepID=A0AAW2G6K9_9HYME
MNYCRCCAKSISTVSEFRLVYDSQREDQLARSGISEIPATFITLSTITAIFVAHFSNFPQNDSYRRVVIRLKYRPRHLHEPPLPSPHSLPNDISHTSEMDVRGFFFYKYLPAVVKRGRACVGAHVQRSRTGRANTRSQVSTSKQSAETVLATLGSVFSAMRRFPFNRKPTITRLRRFFIRLVNTDFECNYIHYAN